MTDIQKSLFEMQDLKYRDFTAALIPTVDKATIIGVRAPMIRRLAKEMTEGQKADFIKSLPHEYYEENNLHAAIIEGIKDYGQIISELERFLPHIDNWATCDMIRPRIFKAHPTELMAKIVEWSKSEHAYTIRFGLEMLMCYYLDDTFKEEYLDIPATIKNDEYYVRMMVAWFFATALAKQYNVALPYIENKVLDKWTHNKAIQKAIESYRISEEQKAYLKALKL
ncbi:MAG: DNA alkylation repair protein [Clostridia bacterium]|nr:DNA alkylation repair protein [Clostridia bacterium]